MARFRCRFCGDEGSIVYSPNGHACPTCGSTAVQVAAGIEELPEDDPIFEAMRRLADEPHEPDED